MPEVSLAICCAAASVSKLVLFHLPWRCSVITRIFMSDHRCFKFQFFHQLPAASFAVPVRNSVFFVFVGT